MKDIKAYIESGILELYVIGDLDEEQIREVEDLAVRHPEIREELNAIQLSMEKYAAQHAITPTPNIKVKLLESLKLNPSAAAAGESSKVVPLYPARSSSSTIRNLQMALAACSALLILSVFALFSAYNQLDDAKNQISSLGLQNQKYTTAVKYMKQNNEEMQKIIEMGDSPDWAKVQLGGVTKSPDARMTLYWNKRNQDVMLVNSQMNLPRHDADHQYQLWAIVNGKPVDLGVFDVKADSTTLLRKMKAVPSAQAFAVTLEKRGGNPTPTMEQMIVMGGVTI